MDIYLAFKTLHILSATILFGTGIGIAFFMFRSRYMDDIQGKYYVSHNTVLADYFFTLPAAITQPVTGIFLITRGGFNWQDNWLVASYCLYLIAALCWIPVVFIQIRMKEILRECVNKHTELPANYHSLFKLWFWLGWPAFLGLLVIFYMMVFKPI